MNVAVENVDAIRFKWISEESKKSVLLLRGEDSEFDVQSYIKTKEGLEKPKYIVFEKWVQDMLSEMFGPCEIATWNNGCKGFSNYPFEWFVGIKFRDNTFFSRAGEDYLPLKMHQVFFLFAPFFGELEQNLTGDVEEQQKVLQECGALNGLAPYEIDEMLIRNMYFEKFLL